MRLVIPKPNRSIGSLDALALIGVIGLALARWVPIARLVPFWGCGFRKMTGIPCPGCGLTRVADRFAHFHFGEALRANPLGTVAAALFAVAIVGSAVHLALKVPVPELVLDDREWRIARWAMGALFVLNYLWVIYAYSVLHWR